MDKAFDSSVYATADEYFADLAKAYREELADLYDAGCRNVQFDDPLLAYFCAEPMLEGMKAEGRDAEKLLDQYIKLYNDSVRDAPKDMVIGLHCAYFPTSLSGGFRQGSQPETRDKLTIVFRSQQCAAAVRNHILRCSRLAIL